MTDNDGSFFLTMRELPQCSRPHVSKKAGEALNVLLDSYRSSGWPEHDLAEWLSDLVHFLGDDRDPARILLAAAVHRIVVLEDVQMQAQARAVLDAGSGLIRHAADGCLSDGDGYRFHRLNLAGKCALGCPEPDAPAGTVVIDWGADTLPLDQIAAAAKELTRYIVLGTYGDIDHWRRSNDLCRRDVIAVISSEDLRGLGPGTYRLITLDSWKPTPELAADVREALRGIEGQGAVIKR